MAGNVTETAIGVTEMAKGEKRTILVHKETAELISDPDRFLVKNSGFVLIFAAIISMPLSILTRFFFQDLSANWFAIIATIVPNVVVLGIAIAFIFGYRIKDAAGLRFPGVANILRGLLMASIAYPLAMTVSVLCSMMFPWSVSRINSDASMSILYSIGPLAGFFVLALLPAVSEELICRGIIFGALRKRSMLAAMAVSSVSFAMLHGNIEQFVYTLLFGILLGFAREYTGSVYTTIGMHLLFNSISYVQVYWGEAIDRFLISLAPKELISEENAAKVISDAIAQGILGLSVIAIPLLVILMSRLKWRNIGMRESLDVNKAVPAVTVSYIIGWAACIAVAAIF